MKLSALRAPVPAGLADRILASTGPVDDYAAVAGPVGPLLVAWSRLGISLVLPGQDEVALADTVRERLDRRVRRTSVAPPGLLTALRSGRTARLAVDLRGRSDFERAVLTAARRIPAGEVRSYSWGRRRHRPARGGPRRRHGSGTQPGPGGRALSSGGPQ